MTTRSIAVVGAGFSGTLLSPHLPRRRLPGTRVVLIDCNARFGRGQAHATGNPSHLLNVPAGRMSAFHDRSNDFLDWLHRAPHGMRRRPGRGLLRAAPVAWRPRPRFVERGNPPRPAPPSHWTFGRP